MGKLGKDKEKKRVTMIGGQALMEGVMMRGATSMAMAVRAPDGNILLETKRFKKVRPWYQRVPLVRGVAAFVSSMVTGVSTLMRSAEVSTPDEDMPGKGAMGFAVFLGVVFAVALFILLPSFISWIFERFLGLGGVVVSSLIEGALRLLIFILYLLLVSKMKDIKRTFMYHGAEHRTINCFERGEELTVENVQKCSTRHNRCGTTFLFFVMVISIVVFSLTNWAFSAIGGVVASNVFVKLGIRILLLPVVAGLSYELLRGLAKLPDNKFTFVLRAPGLALQRLTTYPPEDEMAEVALVSFNAVYEMDNDQNIPELKFGERFLKDLRAELKEILAGKEECEPDVILRLCLGLKASELTPYRKINAFENKKVTETAKRRAAGEPLAYILGYGQFMSYRIEVNPDVLIPRPETELLAESAVREIGGRECAALDLCTGSGCIALCIASETKAAVTASDISESALKVAERNLKNTGVELVISDMFEGLSDRIFDVIVSNPPYIAAGEFSSLSSEVLKEPRIALCGGDDGLDFYRIIAETAPKHLSEGGALLLEIGCTQGEAVTALLEKAGFRDVEIIKDYGGADRIVRAKRK